MSNASLQTLKAKGLKRMPSPENEAATPKFVFQAKTLSNHRQSSSLGRRPIGNSIYFFPFIQLQARPSLSSRPRPTSTTSTVASSSTSHRVFSPADAPSPAPLYPGVNSAETELEFSCVFCRCARKYPHFHSN